MFASSALPELQTTLAPSAAVSGARLAPVTAGPAYVTTGQASAAEDVESIAILSQMLQNEAQRHQRERSVLPTQHQQQHGSETTGGDIKETSETSDVDSTSANANSAGVSVPNDVLSELMGSGGTGTSGTSGTGGGTSSGGTGSGTAILRGDHHSPALMQHTAIFLEPSSTTAVAAAAAAQRLSIDQLIAIPGFGGTIAPHFLARPASPIINAMTAAVVATSGGVVGTNSAQGTAGIVVAAAGSNPHLQQQQQVQIGGHHQSHHNHGHHHHHSGVGSLSHHQHHHHHHQDHHSLHQQQQQQQMLHTQQSLQRAGGVSITVSSSPASTANAIASSSASLSVSHHPSAMLRLAAIDADVLSVAKDGTLGTGVRIHTSSSSASSPSTGVSTVASSVASSVLSGVSVASEASPIIASATATPLESTSLWLTASAVSGAAASTVLGEVKREPLGGANTEEAAHGLLALHKQHCDRVSAAVAVGGDLSRHLPADGDEFKCDICDVRLKRKAHMARHRRTHTNERPHVCTVCYKGFIRREHLLRHLKIHEPGYVPSRPSPSSADHRVRPYQCVYCGRGFLRRYHLQRHITTQGTCPALAAAAVAAAAASAAGGAASAAAAVTATPLADPGNSPPVRHPCDLCGSTFLRREHMKRHRKTHTGKKEHACYLCGKAFFRREHVRKHVLSHNRGPRGSNSGATAAAAAAVSTAEQQQQQQQQQLFDVTMAAAVVAANTADGQRAALLTPHSGVGLDVTLGSAGIVANTVSVNVSTQSVGVGPDRRLLSTGLSSSSSTSPGGRRGSNPNQPRNHVCGECGRRFGRKEHLQRHEATHSSTRPFSCGVCGRGFNRKEHLRKHLQNTACASTTNNNNGNNNTSSGSNSGGNNSNSNNVSSGNSSSTLVKREQPDLQQQQLVMLASGGGGGGTTALLHHSPHVANTVHHSHHHHNHHSHLPHHNQQQQQQQQQFQLHIGGTIGGTDTRGVVASFVSQQHHQQHIPGELVLDMSTGSTVSDVTTAASSADGSEEVPPSTTTAAVTARVGAEGT